MKTPRAIAELIEALNEVCAELDAAEDFVATVEFGDLPVEQRVAHMRRIDSLTAEWRYIDGLIVAERNARRAA